MVPALERIWRWADVVVLVSVARSQADVVVLVSVARSQADVVVLVSVARSQADVVVLVSVARSQADVEVLLTVAVPGQQAWVWGASLAQLLSAPSQTSIYRRLE